jgi:transcriptional regulator with XRE-family HTH domain
MAPNNDFSVAPIAAIEAEIGRRLEALRLAANVSQAEVAAEAGISRRTMTRLENGEGVSLDTLIRVMRALGVAGRLEALLTPPEVRPVERIRRKGRQRQRARPSARSTPAEWTWGDTPDVTPDDAT